MCFLFQDCYKNKKVSFSNKINITLIPSNKNNSQIWYSKRDYLKFRKDIVIHQLKSVFNNN
jgi:hypothetical protein